LPAQAISLALKGSGSCFASKRLQSKIAAILIFVIVNVYVISLFVFLAIAEAAICLYDVCTDCNGCQNDEKKSSKKFL